MTIFGIPFTWYVISCLASSKILRSLDVKPASSWVSRNAVSMSDSPGSTWPRETSVDCQNSIKHDRCGDSLLIIWQVIERRMKSIGMYEWTQTFRRCPVMLPIWRLHQEKLDGILKSAENDEAASTLLHDGRSILYSKNLYSKCLLYTSSQLFFSKLNSHYYPIVDIYHVIIHGRIRTSIIFLFRVNKLLMELKSLEWRGNTSR